MLGANTISKVQKAVKKTAYGRGGRLPLIFGALSDARRFQIFKLLLEYRDICVTDVAKVFDISASAASQQLRILERTGLVKRERNGQMTCYEVKKEDPTVRSILKTFFKGRKL